MNEIAQYVGSAVATIGKKNTEIAVQLQEKGIAEASVFSGPPASNRVVGEIIARLTVLFPDMNVIALKELGDTIIEEEWSEERLKYAFDNIKRCPYQTFRIGSFLGFDKSILFGRSVNAIMQKLGKDIPYSDIVMIKIQSHEKGEERAYALKDIVEESFPQIIVGRWDDNKKEFVISGTITDKTIEKRQNAFKAALFEFCDHPPRYTGRFKVETVKAFYDKWSRVIPPGDKLLFEVQPGWNTESRLEGFAMYQSQQNKQKQ